MTTTYEPKGKIKPFTDAVKDNPARIWTVADVADLINVKQGAVSAYLEYSIRNGLVHRGQRAGKTVFAGQPFPPEAAFPLGTRAPASATPAPPPAPTPAPTPAPAPAPDLRVPQFTTWTPPKMTAPRPGSDIRLPKFADTPAPAPGAEVTNPPPALTPSPIPAPAPSEEPTVESDEIADESAAGADEEQGEEIVEPDAFLSARTGEIVLVGVDPDEEGRVTIPADLVQRIRSQIAWMPPR